MLIACCEITGATAGFVDIAVVGNETQVFGSLNQAQLVCPAALGLLHVNGQRADNAPGQVDLRKAVHCFSNLAHIWHTSRTNTSSDQTVTWNPRPAGRPGGNLTIEIAESQVAIMGS